MVISYSGNKPDPRHAALTDYKYLKELTIELLFSSLSSFEEFINSSNT